MDVLGTSAKIKRIPNGYTTAPNEGRTLTDRVALTAGNTYSIVAEIYGGYFILTANGTIVQKYDVSMYDTVGIAFLNFGLLASNISNITCYRNNKYYIETLSIYDPNGIDSLTKDKTSYVINEYYSHSSPLIGKGYFTVDIQNSNKGVNTIVVLKADNLLSSSVNIEYIYTWFMYSEHEKVRLPKYFDFGIYYIAIATVDYKQTDTSTTLKNFSITIPNLSAGNSVEIPTTKRHIVLYKCEIENCAVEKEEFISPLKGKKWSILGDSRSSTSSRSTEVIKYYTQIANMVDGMAIESVAVSGKRFRDSIESTQIQNITIDPDIITVLGGVNDWCGDTTPTPLGEFGDTVEDQTFYGYVDSCVKKLLTNYPNAILIFITPMGEEGFSTWKELVDDEHKNINGLTIESYCNAIKEVCAFYSVPVYDDRNEGGYTPYIDSLNTYYFFDGLHQKTNAHAKIAANLYAMLLDLTNDN